MISVNKLNKFFDRHHAVKDLSFKIERGDVVGFLGPNGAGKSTTMKMLTGFLSLSSGQVLVSNLDIEKSRLAVQRKMGYLPEGAPAYADMTVYEFLYFIAKVRKIERSNRQQSIDNVVAQVDLQEVLNKPIETLSKGFKRRVGLAQAILHDPEILILDEPTDGLDPNQKHQVRKLIQNLAKDKIVIISTHIMEEVTAVCNRVIIIANGEMKFDGTPESLRQQSKWHNAVTLSLSYAADVSGVLELEGVADLNYDKNTGRVTVFPENGANILAKLSQFCQQTKLPVDAIYPEQGNLEDVFRLVTSAEYTFNADLGSSANSSATNASTEEEKA
ncbi:ABC transporter ATP-binding protein [Glaciecola sp. KUL10]|jgi:ABC-2 type transport system ATP-binding protein|uniref:ABC transporter ATP-binding protein n=1 Tax=Glaciecola sp. (strain KUL10) TaxID=2161813 RepID=UPI000D787B9E|nr:ABC transporter ATP-binding protein [Glaciecola sp. KUL10]GBL04733.1 ABC transporter [Glaciecola sp. KUL10]